MVFLGGLMSESTAKRPVSRRRRKTKELVAQFFAVFLSRYRLVYSNTDQRMFKGD